MCNFLLKIFNSLTRKEEFFQSKSKEVKMYTCGPSTYQRPHIGNYRTFLFEDIVQRYLEYLGYEVTRMITLTNIEDKAIDYAEAAGVSIEELTNRNEAIFFKEFEQLRIKRPQFTIRASTIVDQALKLIKALIEKGIAYKYTHKGAKNVYFNPLKFKGFGKLAHLDMNEWPKKTRRFHLDTYPGMPWNKGDFILWHGCKIGEKVCWESEFGKGRPAWNIQDAAMVTKHLGFNIDLACGGIDNMVRHHDYTISIVESVSGKQFAKYWLHGGHLFVEGKKMSKSSGNVLYPETLTERGYRNEHVRFFLIYGDYRKRQNFTWKKLEQTRIQLDKFKLMVKDLQQANFGGQSIKGEEIARSIKKHFQDHMSCNLDVKAAFDSLYADVSDLYALLKENKLTNRDSAVAIRSLVDIDVVLQVIF